VISDGDFLDMTDLLLICAAFLAGIMNAVAGGGSFLTFPSLVFAGVPPVMANATNTVALFPGALAAAWAYRDDFPRLENLSVRMLAAVSLVGAVLGALLLIFTPEQTFRAAIPWLLLAATLLFATGPRLTPILRRHVHLTGAGLYGMQFCVAIYGGYFGGAIGILMLAAFTLYGLTNIHSMNALKSLLGGTLNGVAVVCFVIAGKVDWPPALMMLVAAVAGGYVGAKVARRMNPDHVRALIIAIGTVMTVVFFSRS
jgi:uncharacterized membrane protein YfcA